MSTLVAPNLSILLKGFPAYPSFIIFTSKYGSDERENTGAKIGNMV